MDFSQLFTPVVAYLFGVQTEHGVAIVGILAADIEHGMARLEVDGRQKDACAASLAGSLYDGIAVFAELFAIQMTMGIGVVQIRNERNE